MLPLFLALILAAPPEAERPTLRFDFNADPLNQLPKDWGRVNLDTDEIGDWKIIPSDSPDFTGKVLAQLSSHGHRRQYNLCMLHLSDYQDLEFSIRLKKISGQIDQGGGLVWRALDSRNYYLCRWNPLEDNVRLFKVVHGRRSQLDTATLKLDPVKTDTAKLDPDAWHTLRIAQVGREIEAFLDEHRLLEAEDDELPQRGRIGLWTKSDAITHFDDIQARPIKALSKPVK